MKSCPAIVPGHSAEAASPKAKPGDSGIALYIKYRVTGMLKFRRSCPARDKGIDAEQKAISRAEGTILIRALFCAPMRSHSIPPPAFPRNTKAVIIMLAAAVVFHGKLTALPPTALTATARVSSIIARMGNFLFLLFMIIEKEGCV